MPVSDSLQCLYWYGFAFYSVLWRTVLVQVRHFSSSVVYLLSSSYNCWAHSLQPSEFLFLKVEKKHFDTFPQQVFLARYFWPLSDISIPLVCICACGKPSMLGSPESWFCCPSFLSCDLHQGETSLPCQMSSLPQTRNFQALHVTSQAGKSTKWKMCKVSRTVQQPKLPENRKWKSFQLYSLILLFLPHTPTR